MGPYIPGTDVLTGCRPHETEGGPGCAFRNTTYRVADYAKPAGEFGLLLNHPRFLEWIRVPQSAGSWNSGTDGEHGAVATFHGPFAIALDEH